MKTLLIKGTLFKWEGPATWFFLPTTKAQGEVLRAREKKRIGWGAVRVRVIIGGTTFDTSLFPTKDGPYLLPIKASVRKKEGLEEGSAVTAKCVFL